jgi:hypothetical protein
MTTLTIDLTGFDTHMSTAYIHRVNETGCWRLTDIDESKRAVKEYKLTKICGTVDTIVLKIPNRVDRIYSHFLMHLLGPAARKLTPDVLAEKLVLDIHGNLLRVADSTDRMCLSVRRYLNEERTRIAERAVKKAAMVPDNILWGEPVGLFVPDINTKLRLVLPRQFHIHSESRNEKFLQWIFQDPAFRSYRSYRGDKNLGPWSVTMNPGSILIVDRVYIRQGKGFEDFSSLTFRIQKGSTITYKGDIMTAKGNHRFWAKLRDVNKLMVEVDLNSLPGQEKEGVARK